MSHISELRALIPSILARYDAGEKYLANGVPLDAATAQNFEKFSHETNQLKIKLLREVMARLLDFDKWGRLAASPKKFDQELETNLRLVKRLLKLMYAIPKHRPTVNAARDQQLVELQKAHPDWSFERIGRKAGMGQGQGKIVERALSRLRDRERARLQTDLGALAEFLEIVEPYIDIPSAWTPPITTITT